MTGKTIAEMIAEFGAGLKYDALPQTVVHEAKRRLIDSFACALGAYYSPPVKVARSSAPEVKNGPGAAIIGEDFNTTPESAAFINGVMVRYLDFNDTYLSREPAHPSDNIPAALAAACVSGADGKSLITAIVAAYEVQCGLCDAASLRRRGWDHVTYGAFSATLAASMLLGLDTRQTVHALSIAGTTSPALRQTRAGELSMWKGCAFANASRNALFAAMLAKAGMTGPSPLFEGEFGFFKLVSGEFTLNGLGKDGHYRISDSCIKYYPAEYHGQSAIGAAMELSKEIEDTASIEYVTIRTFGAAYEIIGSGEEKWRPSTRETADHSLPFCVAAALMDGRVTVETFSEERLRDERLLALLKRTRVVKDEELDRMYPEAMPNRIEVTLSSGEMLSREIIYPKGHPKNPLTDLEVEGKFRDLGGWYFAGSEMDTALNALWNTDGMKKASEIFDIFRKGEKRKHARKA